MFGVFGRRKEAPDPAPAIAAIGRHLGSGELQRGYSGPSYVGQREGYRIEIPENLGRLIVPVAVENLETLSSNVRFKSDGSVRRGQQAVSAMTAEGQAAVAALGALGASEIDSYNNARPAFLEAPGASETDTILTVQCPYGLTPTEFAAALPLLLEQTVRLAAALGPPPA